MAKVTMIIEDLGESVDLRVLFDPEIEKDKKLTPAQSIAAHMLEMLKKLKDITSGETNDS